MKTDKTKILAWIIGLLVIFNLTTLATIGYNRYAAPQNQNFKSSHSTERGFIQYNGRFFRDSLNLNREQMSKFREINHAFRSDVNSLNGKLRNLRQRMMDNMASSNPDTLALNQLSDSIGVLHAKLKRNTYHYYLSIKKICNIKQQAKLKNLFIPIFGTEDPSSCSGKGSKHRSKCTSCQN